MQEIWASILGGKENLTLAALLIDVGIINSKPNGGRATRVQITGKPIWEPQLSRPTRALDITGEL